MILFWYMFKEGDDGGLKDVGLVWVEYDTISIDEVRMQAV